MENFWNSISTFFTTTIPTFAKTNWWIVELVLACLALLFFIVLIIVACKKNKKIKKMESDLEFSNRENGWRRSQIDLLDKSNYAYKDEKKKLEQCITDLNNEKEELNKEIEGWKEEVEKINDEKKQVQSVNESLSSQLAESEKKIKYSEDVREQQADKIVALTQQIQEKNDKTHDLEETIESLDNNIEVIKNEKNSLQDKYDKVVAENDTLRNYEFENQILVKAMRSYKNETSQEQAEQNNTIAELTKKVETLSEYIKENKNEKSALSYEEHAHLEDMKRSELSAIAKRLGIKNFATWTNKALRDEIKN